MNFSINHSGGNGIDADAFAGDLSGKACGDAIHRTFGAGIVDKFSGRA
jgi:hypothetical protein